MDVKMIDVMYKTHVWSLRVERKCVINQLGAKQIPASVYFMVMVSGRQPDSMGNKIFKVHVKKDHPRGKLLRLLFSKIIICILLDLEIC